MKKSFILFLIILLSLFSVSYVNAQTCDTLNDARAYYSFDSDCVTDSSTNGYDGTNNGATNVGTSVLGNACDFETSESDYVNIDVVGTAWLDGAGTLSGWIKLESFVNSFGIVGFGSNPGNGVGIDEVVRIGGDAANHLSSQIYVNPDNNGVEDSVDRSSDTDWHHVVMTFDSDGHINKFYVDGSSIGTDSTNTVTIDTLNEGTIGSWTWRGSRASYHADGIIDEVGMWEREISVSEIGDLYNSGSGCNPYAVAGTLTLNTDLVNNTNSSNNPFTFNVNGTVADTTDIWNVSFYVNSSLYDTVINTPLNNTNIQFNFTDGKGFYEFNITAINNDSVSDSFVRSKIFIDTINPQITFNSITNNSEYNKIEDTLDFNIVINDTHLEAINFTVFRLDKNNDRELIINNTFVENIVDEIYQVNFTDDFSNSNWFNDRRYEVRQEAWDGHTNNILRGEPTKVINTLHYEGIKFYCDFTLDMDWEIEGDSIKPIIDFTLPRKKQTCYYETNNEWTKVKRHDERLSLWYVDLKNLIWIDEKHENVETDLLGSNLLKIVYTFEENTDHYKSESFGDLNYNSQSVFFDLEQYTSYFANIINISDFEVVGDTYQLISNTSVNLTDTRDIFFKFVTNSKKNVGGGSNTLFFKLDVNGTTLFDDSIRTMSNVNDIGVSGFFVNTSLSSGVNQIELYSRETGANNIELSNIDFILMSFKTQNDENVCSVLADSNILTVDTTTFSNIRNISLDLGYNSSFMLQNQYTVNASASETVDLFLQDDDLINSSILTRYLSDANDIGSMFNSFITNHSQSTHNIKLFARSRTGNTVTVDENIIGFCTETQNNTVINNKVMENLSTNLENNITYNAGINTILTDTFVLENATGVVVEASFIFKSLTGAQTPIFNVSSGTCTNTKPRYLSDNNDIGNAFMICKFNGFSVGDTLNFNATVEVEAGEQIVLLDEIINVFEVENQDITVSNIPPVITFSQNLTAISDSANAVFNVSAVDFNDATINVTAYWYVQDVLVSTESYIVTNGDQQQFTLSSALYVAEETVFANITSYDNTVFGNTLTTNSIVVSSAITGDTLLLQSINETNANINQTLNRLNGDSAMLWIILAVLTFLILGVITKLYLLWSMSGAFALFGAFNLYRFSGTETFYNAGVMFFLFVGIILFLSGVVLQIVQAFAQKEEKRKSFYSNY